jgi:MFS family permease
VAKSGYAITVFCVLSILYFFSLIHRIGIAVIAVNLMQEFHANSSILGLMSSMYFWPYALAQIPVGIMLDRIGIRKTVTILGFIAVIGSFLFSTAPSILMLGAGRALVGFGVGGFYVSSLKAIAVWFSPKRFATLTGALTSIGNIGGLVATSPLALFSLMIGWRDAFLIISFFMFLFTIVAWFVIKGEEGEQFKSKGTIGRDLRKVFSTRAFLKLTLIPVFVYGFFISFQGLWGGPFLHDVYGMTSPGEASFLLFIALGFMLVGPLAGLLSDRIGRRKPVLIAGISLGIIFWLIMALAGGSLGSVELAAMMFLLGTSFGLCNVYMTVAKELFGESICGLGIASYNTFQFIGAGFFEFFMGFMLDVTYGGTRVFAAYQLIFALGVALLAVSLLTAVLSRETFESEPACPG